LPPIIQWVGIVVGVFFLTILLPGYIAARLFRLIITSKDIQTITVYSTGIALVSVPIVLYWLNFFGVPINLVGVAMTLLIVFALPGAVQLIVLVRRRLEADT
jgi:hypothetical protein